MKYDYSWYVWVYNISKCHTNMVQYILISNMEAGLTFNLSNFSPTLSGSLTNMFLQN